MAEQRGRPIELLPISWKPGIPCGLLVATGSADYIVYASDTSPLHRQHILLHEVAHLLCGHADEADTASGELMPHLSADLVRRVLGRTVYSEPQEQEAELLASMIMNRAVWANSAAEPEPELEPGAARGAAELDPFFGPPPRRRRKAGPSAEGGGARG
ncbi:MULTISPECIES: ParH-like protein [unclassified Kitasatospora]|uniref:ParH-like protein n=1 Tax=unclassified Kitasatospora TaxID=2633591 RepID=UPI002474CC1D|nr:ParH-like protein [Kitasatospora sp. MAP12-44]